VSKRKQNKPFTSHVGAELGVRGAALLGLPMPPKTRYEPNNTAATMNTQTVDAVLTSPTQQKQEQDNKQARTGLMHLHVCPELCVRWAALLGLPVVPQQCFPRRSRPVTQQRQLSLAALDGL
jgi:hypothetical protein